MSLAMPASAKVAISASPSQAFPALIAPAAGESSRPSRALAGGGRPFDCPVTGECRLAVMRTVLSIGDFSRMTHLSIKTLRHYHQVGLLAPAEVNPDTSYRYYTTDQVPAAQVIRRFRDLGMPVDEVRAVLAAPDPAARSA